MKRQKRNQTQRAMARGYHAGINGKSRNICPYESGEARHVWLSGWREAREDLWNGYNPMAQAQRLSHLHQ